MSLLTLFLWEHLAGQSLHPIQYGLMGLRAQRVLSAVAGPHVGLPRRMSWRHWRCARCSACIAGAFEA